MSHSAKAGATGLAIATLLLLTLPQGLVAAETPMPLAMETRHLDPETGEVLFTGRQELDEVDGNIRLQTWVYRPDGERVKHSESLFDMETLRPVRHEETEDLEGEWVRFELSGETGRIESRERAGGDLNVRTVKWQEGALLPNSVASYIRRHWNTLQDGGQLNVPVVVFGRAAIYHFTVTQDATHALAGDNQRVARMEASNWFVRQFVDPIYFVFDTTEYRKLVTYEGRSGLRKGENGGRLRIEFRYEAMPTATASARQQPGS